MDWSEILESWGVEVPQNLEEEDKHPYKVLAGILEDRKEVVINSFKREKTERIMKKLASMRNSNGMFIIPIRTTDNENKEILVDPILSSFNNLFSVF